MRTENILGLNETTKKIFQKAHLPLRINTSIIQQYILINQVNVSAITIYPRLFGTRLIGTRPIGTRLIGTLKIDRVSLERVSLAAVVRSEQERPYKKIQESLFKVEV